MKRQAAQRPSVHEIVLPGENQRGKGIISLHLKMSYPAQAFSGMIGAERHNSTKFCLKKGLWK
jgi:hypothetical protein